jgi:hypothetical protein
MRVKHLAIKNAMAKGKSNAATSRVTSTITKKEVEKARTDGLISAQDSIKFPSTERVPEPPSGYQVMVFFFLPMSFFVGFSFFMVCGFTGSHLTLFYTLLVS